ncbi:MAG TPA: hypothetical protein PKC40_02830 [Saprospiraceae bacterium]|nr:hypothetical protein [Saprospiraceae bacterium]
MAAKTLDEKFEEIGQQIKNAVVDFTTLEVTTITGEIKHIIDDKGKFNVKDVVSQLGKTGQNQIAISLVAHTHVDFDHDTVNFVASELGKKGKELFEIHQNAVSTAHEARRAFLNFIREVID